MALFGEIVEPSSRVWDDDNDEYSLPENSLAWSTDVIAMPDVDQIIILEGKYLGCIDTTKSNYQLINSIAKVNLNLYKEDTRLICCIKDYDLIRSSEIVTLLLQYIQPRQRVTAVVSRPLAEYKSEGQKEERSYVRCLCTEAWKTELPYPKLDQPNIVSGVSAGIISIQNRMKNSAILYVCYLDHPDNINSDDLHSLFSFLNIELVPANITASNLYI